MIKVYTYSLVTTLVMLVSFA